MFKSALITLAILSSVASADLFVPGGYEHIEGNWENRHPLSGTSRYQQIWDGSLFGVLSGPVEITSVSFRVDGPAGAGFDGGNVFGTEIRLSTSSANENTISSTYDNNIGADETLVRDTSINQLHLSSTAAFTASGTRVFDVTIEFDQSFIYDPSQGALLLDVIGTLGSTGQFFDGVEFDNDGMSRVYSQVGTEGGSHDSGALVAQFNYNTVPTPSSLALLSVAGLVTTRRRR